ncbi:hypothetical protein [uncultured Agathobaculum sp.]
MPAFAGIFSFCRRTWQTPVPQQPFSGAHEARERTRRFRAAA